MSGSTKLRTLLMCSVATFSMRTSHSLAQENTQRTIAMFPRFEAGIYGAQPANPQNAITVYPDQTCDSQSSGRGSVVTTFDGSSLMCLSDQGYSLYDKAHDITYSSVAQIIKLGTYGKPPTDLTAGTDASMDVVTNSRCYSRASGWGLTVVAPDRLTQPTNRQNLLCLSPHGDGYTSYNLATKKSFTAVTLERGSVASDQKVIAYEVVSKIMRTIDKYISGPSHRLKVPRALKHAESSFPNIELDGGTGRISTHAHLSKHGLANFLQKEPNGGDLSLRWLEPAVAYHNQAASNEVDPSEYNQTWAGYEGEGVYIQHCPPSQSQCSSPDSIYTDIFDEIYDINPPYSQQVRDSMAGVA